MLKKITTFEGSIFKNMSKILITGNGFDLFHHLPTKYAHFISIMITIEEVEYDTDVSFEKLFGRVFKSRHQSDYHSIIKNYNTTNIIFSHEKLIQIKELLKTNLWYKHFKNVCEIDTWIDFENEIENVLIQLSSLIKYSEENKTIYTTFNKRELNIYIDFSEFGLCKNNDSQVSYFDEDNINTRTGKFDAKGALDKMIVSFDEFINCFDFYLSHIVFQLYDVCKVKLILPLESIDTFYTFNYTPTLEKFHKINSNVIYLHNKINAKNSIQNIVLGVAEIPDEIKSNKYFEFTKYYQKIIKGCNYNFIELPTENTDISEENIFYIFGHSLDKSDNEYIEQIFLYLEKDYLKKSNIVVFYFDQKDRKNKLKNLFSFIKKELVIKFSDSGRLKFIELNDINIIKEFNKKVFNKYEDYKM